MLKRYFKFVAALILIMSLLSGCTQKGNDGVDANTTADDKKVRIGVAMATEIQQRWKYDEKFMKLKAEELGAELLFQWANYDVTKQSNQVENLLSQEIDALIFVGVNNKMLNLVERVKAEGIPVIAYDQLILDAPLDLYVDRDNEKVGRLQMEAAIEFTDGQGNYVLIKGDPTSTVAQGIAKGYEQVIAHNPKVNVVSDQWHQNWSPEKALKTAENALSANQDNVQAFIASADSVALGVVPAIKASKLEGQVFLSGLDVEKASARLIAQGIQTMSVWTKIDEGAMRTVEAAVKLAKGQIPEHDTVIHNGPYEVPTLLVDVVAINKGNLDEFIDEIAPEGWITREDVYVEE